MTFKKIELLDRITDSVIMKYVVFQHVITKKYLMFYEYKMDFPSMRVAIETPEQTKNAYDEMDEVVQAEQLYFINQLLAYSPDKKHKQIFETEHLDGFDELDELLDTYLRKYNQKTLHERFLEQIQERETTNPSSSNDI